MLPFTHANHQLKKLKPTEPEKAPPAKPNPFKKRTATVEQRPRPGDAAKATIFKIKTKQTIGKEGMNNTLKELVERTPLATAEKRTLPAQNQTFLPSTKAPGSPRTDSPPRTPLSQSPMKQALFDDNLSDLE